LAELLFPNVQRTGLALALLRHIPAGKAEEGYTGYHLLKK